MWYYFSTEFILFIGFYFFLSFFIIFSIVFKKKDEKYKNVMFPTYEESDDKKKTKTFKTKTSDKGLKKQIEKTLRKNKLDEKIKHLYEQVGMPDKDYNYFITQNLKYLTYGFVMGFMLYFSFGNIIITIVTFLLVGSMHIIDIFATIGERKAEFREQFPFFLKTISFVLDNGANLSVAFKEVVEKSKDGVLKEVMTDVLLIQKINGGDFLKAFQYIPTQINTPETREFVEIVESNHEKGVPIAHIFSSQSDTLTKLINNKKMKKVNSIENKLVLPLLMAFVAVGLLIWAAF